MRMELRALWPHLSNEWVALVISIGHVKHCFAQARTAIWLNGRFFINAQSINWLEISVVVVDAVPADSIGMKRTHRTHEHTRDADEWATPETDSSNYRSAVGFYDRPLPRISTANHGARRIAVADSRVSRVPRKCDLE